MFIRFLSRYRLLKWLVLFVSAIGLAIVLAQTLNRPVSFFTNSTSPAPAVTANQSATSAALQPQDRYDRRLVHYATVSRSDGSFRQMFIDENSIPGGMAGPNAVVQPGEVLPDGTLIVMETWYSPENIGTVFVKQKQDGEWQYGSFSPDRPDYQLSFSGSCHSCHAPFPDTDFTLTKPLLEAALKTQQVQTAFCDRPGRTPCEPEIYIPNAS